LAVVVRAHLPMVRPLLQFIPALAEEHDHDARVLKHRRTLGDKAHFAQLPSPGAPVAPAGQRHAPLLSPPDGGTAQSLQSIRRI